MKRIFFIMLLTLLMVLPCYATEAALEDEGVGLPTLDENNEAQEGGEEIEQTDDGASGMTPDEFKAFLDEKVVPYVIVAVSAVAAIYVAISPILAKIKASSDQFDTATGGLAEANKQGKAAQEQSASMLSELRAEREAQRAEQAAFEGKMSAQLQAMSDLMQGALGATSEQTREIRDMALVAFCNNRELVERGYAKQIARIAQGRGGEITVGADDVEESGERSDSEEVDEHEPSEDQEPA